MLYVSDNIVTCCILNTVLLISIIYIIFQVVNIIYHQLITQLLYIISLIGIQGIQGIELNIMSQSISSSEIPSSLQATPNSFKIELSLNKETYVDLLLHNTNTIHSIIFKIKTTAKDRYMLRPTADVILPNSSKICRIVLCKFTEYPSSNDKATRDKFLIQSKIIIDMNILNSLYDSNNDMVHTDVLSQYWKSVELQHNPKSNQYTYSEQIIRTKLIVPDDSVADMNMADNTTNGNINKPTTNILPQSVSSNIPPESVLESRVASVNAARVKYSTANTTDVNNYDRIDLERNKNDYNELMDFTVKLTSQCEKLKSDLSALQLQHHTAQSTIQQLHTQIYALQQQSRSDSELLDQAGIKTAPRITDTITQNNNSNFIPNTNDTIKHSNLINFHVNIVFVFIIGIITWLIGKFYR